jgi:hypothetical protein
VARAQKVRRFLVKIKPAACRGKSAQRGRPGHPLQKGGKPVLKACTQYGTACDRLIGNTIRVRPEKCEAVFG